MILKVNGSMNRNYLQQSALAHFHLAARASARPRATGVTLCERPWRGQLVLRGDIRSRAFTSALQRVLGASVPRTPNTAKRKDGTVILWLGPDEWLIVVPGGREMKLEAELRGALARQHTALTDVSDSRVVIGLTGPHAREVLMKGCSLDLHPRAFAAGRCAQTGLARTHMLLHQLDESPAYDIYVHRSFADYVWRWLESAAAEYGMAITTQDGQVPQSKQVRGK
jgi:sarcosine oxidase subunit gamma